MEALGIDLKWFLFQMGNFIILLGILTYFLHKPLLKLLEARKQEIAEGLENARQMKQELTSTMEQQTDILEDARKESAAILQETKKRATQLEADLTAKAKEKTEQMSLKAHQDLESEREQLRKELKADLASMVVQATEKILSENVSAEKEKEIKRQVTNITPKS